MRENFLSRGFWTPLLLVGLLATACSSDTSSATGALMAEDDLPPTPALQSERVAPTPESTVAPLSETPDSLASKQEIRDSRQTVLAFFDAFQAGDFPSAFFLLDRHARVRYRIPDPAVHDFTGVANEPAWEAITDRMLRLVAAVGNTSPLLFQQGQIVLEESVVRGALPVDITAGISDLMQVDGDRPDEQLFTATLNSTGEQVEITAVMEVSGEWAVRRIGAPGTDPSVLPFAGSAGATSASVDPGTFSSVYDGLGDATPKQALTQIESFAQLRDGMGIFLMLDERAQLNAIQATVFNPRWLLTLDGHAAWETLRYAGPRFIGSDPRRFDLLLEFAVAENQFAVPLAGYSIVGQSDSTDEFGRPVAVLDAEHADVPGQFVITMRRELRGWRLTQILAPEGAVGRLPFSADSNIEVWAEPEGFKTVSIDSMREVVLASIADTTADPETQWSRFVAGASDPSHGTFRTVWFDVFGADDRHLVYVSLVDDELPWPEIRSPQDEIGRAHV